MIDDVTEGLPSGSWSLLGVELWGSPPLGYVRLPLVADRISVLYGLNGAGKSTVLAAFGSALRGRCDGSPFLNRFRIHAERRDPGSDDSLTDLLHRRSGFGPFRRRRGTNAAFDRVLGSRPDRSELDPLREHLARITGDPCCTSGLAAGLQLSAQRDAPLRVTLTADDRDLRVAISARPDGTSFELLGQLLLQEAASVPLDPIIAGSAMATVWDALRGRTEPVDDHECIFYPGPRNLSALASAKGNEAERVRRAIAARWVSDWLFAGEFLPLARASHPAARWQGVPIVEIARMPVEALGELVPLEVASDADDVRVSATRVVRSIAALPISMEMRRREEAQRRADREDAESAQAQMDWTMEQHRRYVEPAIVDEMLRSGEMPAAHTVRFPHSPRAARIAGAPTWTDERGSEQPPVRIPVRDAVRAANTALRMWTSEFLTLPTHGFTDGPLRDRFRAVRAADELQRIEDDTIEVGLDNLSTAQARWVATAISLLSHRTWREGPMDGTARPGSDPHVILLVDEPERALHRGAERDVLGRLERLVQHENATAIVATHSPVLLDTGSVVLHHVRMVEGSIEVESDLGAGTSLNEIAERIGGRRSDVAFLHRLFLLVEGEIDRQVLLGLFEDEFRALRVSIVPMAGTDALHTAITPFALLGLSDAAVMILLDHVDDRRMSEVWSRAAQIRTDRGSAAAIEALDRERFDRTAERMAAQLLSHAIRLGESERVQILGIPSIDILELLPFELLGCRAPRSDFDAQVASESAAGRRWTSRRTKDWLRTNGADISAEGVRRAVSRLDAIPSDLAGILQEVHAAVDRSRTAAAGDATESP